MDWGGRRRSKKSFLEVIVKDDEEEVWVLEVVVGKKVGEMIWDKFCKWNWLDLLTDWMYAVRENKDYIDLGLSNWVIEGDVLMMRKNWGKNRFGVYGEWKLRYVDWMFKWR